VRSRNAVSRSRPAKSTDEVKEVGGSSAPPTCGRQGFTSQKRDLRKTLRPKKGPLLIVSEVRWSGKAL